MDYRLAKLVLFIRKKYNSDTDPFAQHLDILQAHLEDLWGYFKDYAEPNFAGDFTNGYEASLCQRYWEMYLTAKYLKLGFKIKKYPDGGPDIGLETNQGIIWIEAVTPSLGKDNELLEFYKSSSEPKLYKVPHEKLTLRVTNAVTNKIKQRNNFIKNRPETANDPYIIAINSTLLGHYGYHDISQYPRVFAAAHGAGAIAIPINPKTMEYGEPHISYRETIAKENGELVDAALFDKDELKTISGFITTDIHLLHSTNSSFMRRFSNGEVFIPNPNAYHPIIDPALIADEILDIN